MKSKVFLSIENISSSYGDTKILHDISFTVGKNSVSALLGANGSGKTTLIKCLCSLQKHEGQCILQNESLEKYSIKQRAKKISYIPQKSGIQMSISVMDVVLMGYNAVLSLLEKPSAKQVQKAQTVLTDLGLKDFANRDFMSLSEGEKQLVILARTIIEEATLLLLDEADSALDFKNRRIFLNEICKLVKTEAKAAVLTLHDPLLALQYCDQLILLKEGKCVGCIYPQKDTMETMEKALSQIYGNIKLKEIEGKEGKRLFAMFMEDEVCVQ